MSTNCKRTSSTNKRKKAQTAEDSDTSSTCSNSEKEPATSVEVSQLSTGESKEDTSNNSNSKFTKFFKYEVYDNMPVAICLECAKKGIHKIIKRKNSNTSGLKKHLQASHLSVYSAVFGTETLRNSTATGQRTLTQFRPQELSKNSDWKSLLINWIAVKRLPFNFFEDQYTERFFHFLNPTISMPKRDTTRRMVMAEYTKLKSIVTEILKENPSKISFTIDGWSSLNCKSYYGITAHFIDSNWELQSLALDFVPSSGSHTGKAIAVTFFNYIIEHGIENKIQGITMDNVSSNTVFMAELKKIMNENQIDFNNIDQHFRCFAHILNLGVQDILKLLNVDVNEDCTFFDTDRSQEEYDDRTEEIDNEENDAITTDTSAVIKLRQTFAKIRHSEHSQLKLRNCCVASNVIYLKPILDIRTRWNSTYDMIVVGLKLKTALTLLWLSCSNELSNLKLNDSEWDLLEQINGYLKHFKAISTILEGDQYVTLPLVIVGFNMLLDKVESIILDLGKKVVKTEVDQVLLLALQTGRDKILEHYYKCNWVYCAVLILDPRHKMETFNLTVWGREMKTRSVNEFEKIYQNKYYVENLTENVAGEQKENENDNIDILSIYSEDTGKKNWRSELEEYSSLKRAAKDTKLLEWWKLRETNFPTMSKMARDLFSIMATSVPCERLFSKAASIMTKTRSSMNDESARARALLCLKSWATCSLNDKIND